MILKWYQYHIAFSKYLIPPIPNLLFRVIHQSRDPLLLRSSPPAARLAHSQSASSIPHNPNTNTPNYSNNHNTSSSTNTTTTTNSLADIPPNAELKSSPKLRILTRSNSDANSRNSPRIASPVQPSPIERRLPSASTSAADIVLCFICGNCHFFTCIAPIRFAHTFLSCHSFSMANSCVSFSNLKLARTLNFLI